MFVVVVVVVVAVVAVVVDPKENGGMNDANLIEPQQQQQQQQSNVNRGGGVLDYTEFCVILQVDPCKQCEEVFQLYDYDDNDEQDEHEHITGKGTGLIDAKEVLVALTNFTGASKDDKLKFAFMVYDEAGNGVITKAELICILKANHMARSAVEVLRKADTILAQCQCAKEQDPDNDNASAAVISYDEFCVVSRKFPNILFPAQNNNIDNTSK